MIVISVALNSSIWPKHNVARLTPLGEPPSPRAAHVATAVGTMVVIQVPSLTVSILLSDKCWCNSEYHLFLGGLSSFRVGLALLACLLRTFMFWIWHNNGHDGIGGCYSTMIYILLFIPLSAEDSMSCAQSGGSRSRSWSTVWTCDGLGWAAVLIDNWWKWW